METQTQFNDTDSTLANTFRRMAAALQNETVTLRELLELVGEQGLLLFCLLLTLPFLLPVSIPGVSTIFGIIIILIGVGVTLNRIPWLPVRLMNHTIKRETLLIALEQGASAFDKLEYWTKPRLNLMTTGIIVNRMNGLALTISGILLLFPLSFIPFSNTLPALAILFLAVGTVQRDGYLIVFGYFVLTVSVIYFAILALLLILGGQMFLL